MLSALAATTFATTVAPPSFEELVAESELIARAQVKAVEPRWVDTPQGRVIKTFVTFSIEKVLKGTPGSEITLPFLGGERDGEGMRVHGMPTFTVGDSDILFVSDRRGIRFCPLVAMMHGRYPLRFDEATGRTYVMRNDGSPLESTSAVQLPHVEGLAIARPRSTARALDRQTFEDAIVRTAQLTSSPSSGLLP